LVEVHFIAEDVLNAASVEGASSCSAYR